MDLEHIRGAVKREEHKSEQEGERVMGVCRESGQVMLAINNLHSRLEECMYDSPRVRLIKCDAAAVVDRTSVKPLRIGLTL